MHGARQPPPADTWHALPPANASAVVSESCASSSAEPHVALMLSGPLRSLLVPSVHMSIRSKLVGAFGGPHVLIARIYDAHSLSSRELARLKCVLALLTSNGGGAWSAPTVGDAGVPSASRVSRCRAAPHTLFERYPYMAYSLARQLTTLRACYEQLLRLEDGRRRRFDWILRTRTDAAYVLPAPAWCKVPASTLLLSRSFSKSGGDASLRRDEYMWSDHAAIVPREHADAYFLGVGRRLDQCIELGERLPGNYTGPESFIYHSLGGLGVRTRCEPTLAPLIVSVEGRMGKWCHRYRSHDTPELAGTASDKNCEERFLGRRADAAAGTGAVAKCMRDQRMSTARTPARLATSNRILQLSSRAAPLPRARASDQ